MKIFGNRRLPFGLVSGLRRGEQEVGPTSDLPAGTVVGVGRYAVGNAGGDYFAVTRSCRHLLGDLAQGSIDKDGCLVCPLHGARYDVGSGQMVNGPRGIYARVPGLGASFQALTRILPLGRGKVKERDGILYVS